MGKAFSVFLLLAELTGLIIVLQKTQRSLILLSIFPSLESWLECIAIARSSTDYFL